MRVTVMQMQQLLVHQACFQSGVKMASLFPWMQETGALSLDAGIGDSLHHELAVLHHSEVARRGLPALACSSLL